MRRIISVPIAFLLVGCTTGYRAANDKSSLARSTLAAPERAFLVDMADSMRDQNKLADLVEKRSKNSSVRDLARQTAKTAKILHAHFAKALAAHNLKASPELSPKTAERIKKLDSLKGVELDRTYVTNQISDLLMDISRCETQARQGQDAGVKALAQQSLPSLNQLLKVAQKTSAALPPAK